MYCTVPTSCCVYSCFLLCCILKLYPEALYFQELLWFVLYMCLLYPGTLSRSQKSSYIRMYIQELCLSLINPGIVCFVLHLLWCIQFCIQAPHFYIQEGLYVYPSRQGRVFSKNCYDVSRSHINPGTGMLYPTTFMCLMRIIARKGRQAI